MTASWRRAAGGQGRRGGLRGLAILSLAAVVTAAGCGGGSKTTSTGGPSSQLVIGTTADGQSVSPPSSADVATAFPLNPGVFETLVTIDKSYQLKPLLATSWQFRAPNTYRLFLRHGVVFQNGEPFNAAAVVYTLTHFWAAGAKGMGSGTLDLDQRSVRVVNPYTIDITPAHPDRRVLQLLANPQVAYVVAPGTYPGGGQTPQSTPTGTGPFKFVSYTPKVQLVLARFKRYWGAKAGVAKMVMRYIPDNATRSLALQSGEVQLITDVPYSSINRLKALSGVKVVDSPVGSSYMLMLNLHGKPPYDVLNDPAVRLAIAYGINRSAVIAAAFDNYAKPYQTYVVPSVLGKYAGLIKGFPYDPKKASQLLSADGWKAGAAGGVRAKAGKPLTVTLIGESTSTFSTVAQLVKAQLATIGVNVTISLNSNSFLSRQRAGTMNMALWQLNQNDATPTYQLRFLTSTDVAFFGVHYYAAGPKFEQLFAEANEAPSLSQAKQFTAQALHVALDKTVSAIALAGTYQIWAMSNKVHDFAPLGAKSDQTWSSISLG